MARDLSARQTVDLLVRNGLLLKQDRAEALEVLNANPEGHNQYTKGGGGGGKKLKFQAREISYGMGGGTEHQADAGHGMYSIVQDPDTGKHGVFYSKGDTSDLDALAEEKRIGPMHSTVAAAKVTAQDHHEKQIGKKAISKREQTASRDWRPKPNPKRSYRPYRPLD